MRRGRGPEDKMAESHEQVLSRLLDELGETLGRR